MSRPGTGIRLKFREGDGLEVMIHAQTTDKLLLVGDNGRAYTLGGDKLPGGRGFGEPVRLLVDLPAEVGISALMAVKPETRLLLASSDGKGFVAKGESVIAETRKGKQVVNLRKGAKVAVVRIVGDKDDSVAVVGENRKMLVFPLGELPEMARGQGVTLQKFRDGLLSDATTLVLADGLSWPLGGGGKRVRTESDLAAWRAARGAAGRMAPMGFPRSNRFEDVPQGEKSSD